MKIDDLRDTDEYNHLIIVCLGAILVLYSSFILMPIVLIVCARSITFLIRKFVPDFDPIQSVKEFAIALKQLYVQIIETERKTSK